MIRQLEHVAVSVSDLDRSVAFYCGLLGFELIRLIEPRDDEKMGTIAGLAGARARIAHLKIGANMLELFEYVRPRGKSIGDRTQADLGCSHIGLRSDDARGDYQRLQAQGVEFISEPVEFRPGVWVVYFRGPDGEMCELREDPQAL
jgi:catechol 2,3-dioxygenase-like lactoylglutathione lyase family enzyme